MLMDIHVFMPVKITIFEVYNIFGSLSIRDEKLIGSGVVSRAMTKVNAEEKLHELFAVSKDLTLR